MLLRARCLAFAAIFGLGACAGRETRSARSAWKQAVERGGAGSEGAAAPSRGAAGRSGANSGTWRDLNDVTTSAAELLSPGISTAPLPALVELLCAEPPPELEAIGPELRVVRCPPKPAMAPLGHSLTAELAGGTVALVAVDLSESDSQALLKDALIQLAGTCAYSWARVLDRGDNAPEEFHTCLTPSGSMVVLGRFTTDLGGELWQFSLAVLGPG